jgi:hypothetical protein
MDETIKEIMERGNRPTDKVIFDTDPARLVAKILAMVAKDKEKEFSPIKHQD